MQYTAIISKDFKAAAQGYENLWFDLSEFNQNSFHLEFRFQVYLLE